MEYNVVRALTERWLAGETSLAEERTLREFFEGAQGDLPRDLHSVRAMFVHGQALATDRPTRRLVMHTDIVPGVEEPVAVRPILRRWIVAASGIAAAVALMIALPRVSDSDSSSEIVCVVNGVRITDPDQVESYTREALEIMSCNFHKPRQVLSANLSGSGSLQLAAEVLKTLTIE